MSRLLIAYDTTEGQTRKIAHYLAESLVQRGHEAQVIDIRHPPSGFSPGGFDAILIGGSIHMGKHSRQLLKFVRRHKASLEAVPTGFFSVSLSAGVDKQKPEAIQYLDAFLQEGEWSPTITTTIAGGLLYQEYGFLKRWLMKKIAKDASKDTDTSKNHEYTDWKALDGFVREFLVQCERHPVKERT